jgi:hypothetical protein
LYGAVVASAVGLAALGYPFGVAALASFGIELSLSFAPGWLVESLRMPRSAAILLGMVGFSSGFERLIGALGMVGFLFHYGCSIGAFTPPPPPSYPLPPLTAFPDWRDDLLSHDGEEKVDETHYTRYCPTPPPPQDARMESLSALWSAHKEPISQDMSKLHPLLIDRVETGDHWQVQNGNRRPSLQEALSYVEEGLTAYIRFIHSAGGELEKQALHIASQLPKERGNHQFDLLIRLALAGQGCPLVWKGETQLIYRQLSGQIENESLESHILAHLDATRRRHFQTFCSDPENASAIQKVLSWIQFLFPDSYGLSDRHYQQLLQICFGVPFHLSPPIQEEELEPIHQALRGILPLAMFDQLYSFFRKHPECMDTSTNIRAWIEQGVNEGAIPYRLVESFFAEQYQQNYPAATREEAIGWVRATVFPESTGYNIVEEYAAFLAAHYRIIRLFRYRPSVGD